METWERDIDEYGQENEGFCAQAQRLGAKRALLGAQYEQSLGFISGPERSDPNPVREMHRAGYRRFLKILREGKPMDEVELVGEVDKYGLELARFVLEAEKQGFSPDQAVKYVSDWAAALPPEQITKDTSLYEYL